MKVNGLKNIYHENINQKKAKGKDFCNGYHKEHHGPSHHCKNHNSWKLKKNQSENYPNGI